MPRKWVTGGGACGQRWKSRVKGGGDSWRVPPLPGQETQVCSGLLRLAVTQMNPHWLPPATRTVWLHVHMLGQGIKRPSRPPLHVEMGKWRPRGGGRQCAQLAVAELRLPDTRAPAFSSSQRPGSHGHASSATPHILVVSGHGYQVLPPAPHPPQP